MGSGYRQIFIGNYTIVYRIEKVNKTVIVITVKYSPSQF
jgi:mRNA-degrading endonuclease RelE of RelBE toxin-antitoxin system